DCSVTNIPRLDVAVAERRRLLGGKARAQPPPREVELADLAPPFPAGDLTAAPDRIVEALRRASEETFDRSIGLGIEDEPRGAPIERCHGGDLVDHGFRKSSSFFVAFNHCAVQ